MKNIRYYVPALVAAAICLVTLMPLFDSPISIMLAVLFSAIAAYDGQALWKRTGGIDHPVYVFLLLGIVEYAWIVSQLDNNTSDTTKDALHALLDIGALFLTGCGVYALYNGRAQQKHSNACKTIS